MNEAREKFIEKHPYLSGLIVVLAFLVFMTLVAVALKGYTTYLRHSEVMEHGWPPPNTNVRAINESSKTNDDKGK